MSQNKNAIKTLSYVTTTRHTTFNIFNLYVLKYKKYHLMMENKGSFVFYNLKTIANMVHLKNIIRI